MPAMPAIAATRVLKNKIISMTHNDAAQLTFPWSGKDNHRCLCSSPTQTVIPGPHHYSKHHFTPFSLSPLSHYTMKQDISQSLENDSPLHSAASNSHCHLISETNYVPRSHLQWNIWMLTEHSISWEHALHTDCGVWRVCSMLTGLISQFLCPPTLWIM